MVTVKEQHQTAIQNYLYNLYDIGWVIHGDSILRIVMVKDSTAEPIYVYIYIHSLYIYKFMEIQTVKLWPILDTLQNINS